MVSHDVVKEKTQGKVNLGKVPGLPGLRNHLQGYLSKVKNVVNLESDVLLPPTEETPDSPETLESFATELDNTVIEQVVTDQDHDMSQDLEAVSLSVGTEWADAAQELSDGSVTSEERNLTSVTPTTGSQDTWAQVVSKKNCKSLVKKVIPSNTVMVNKVGTRNGSCNGISGLPLGDSDTGKQIKKASGLSDGVDKNKSINLTGPCITHKAIVEPIFLAYN